MEVYFNILLLLFIGKSSQRKLGVKQLKTQFTASSSALFSKVSTQGECCPVCSDTGTNIQPKQNITCDLVFNFHLLLFHYYLKFYFFKGYFFLKKRTCLFGCARSQVQQVGSLVFVPAMRDLFQSWHANSQLQCVGSNSLTRDQTWVPCTGSVVLATGPP